MKSCTTNLRRGRRLALPILGLSLVAVALVLLPASLAAATPTRHTAPTSAPATVTAWLSSTQPEHHSTLKVWCRVLDPTGAPFTRLPVRFVWHVDGRRVTVTKHCNSGGFAVARYRIHDAQAGHRDFVSVTPYGADWSITRRLWFVPQDD